MKCFSHADKDALAICKICLKGVCSGCAQDFEVGVSCPGRCAQEMEKQVAMVDVTKHIAKVNKIVGGVLAPLALLALAAWTGYTTALSRSGFDAFSIAMILAFVALGLWLAGIGIYASRRQKAASNYSLKRTNQSLRD